MPLHIIPVGCQGNITLQCSVLWRLLEWRYCSIDMYFFLLYLQPHYTEGKVLFLCRKMCVFGLLASVKLNEDRASKLYLSVFVCSFHTTRPDHRAIWEVRMWLWKGFVLFAKIIWEWAKHGQCKKKGTGKTQQQSCLRCSPVLCGQVDKRKACHFFSFSDYHVSLRIKKANAMIAILVLCFVFIKWKGRKEQTTTTTKSKRVN